jgi:integrase
MGQGNIKNPNAPGKGANVTVDPIRSLKDIRTIINALKGNPRNKLLFVMGINNGLRVTDLLKIRVREVKTARAGEIIRITETKTGKQNVLVINASVYKALQDYLQKATLSDNDFLFKSARGSGAIKRGFVNKLMKRWAARANLKGRYGCASLRKTWGYIQRTVYGVGFEIIAKRFNHSSPEVTVRYLGIQDQEVYDTLMNNIQ